MGKKAKAENNMKKAKNHLKVSNKVKMKHKLEKKTVKVDDSKNEKEEALTLELIQELGGNEEDFKLLSNIDQSKDDTSDISKETHSELKNLISSLNFSKFTVDSLVIKDDKVETSNDKDSKTASSAQDKKKEKLQDNEVSSTSTSDNTEKVQVERSDSDDDEDAAELIPNHNFAFLKNKSEDRNTCVIPSGEKWFEAVSEEVEGDGCNKYWMGKIEKYTKAAWDKDIENYKKASKKGSKKSETVWMETVMKSGTLNDKFSAYVLLLQDSPIHNLSVLETLIDFVNLKSRRPCLMAIENLQKLFLEVLLIPNRKLKNFDKHPYSKLSELSGGNIDIIDKYLISWMFEDRLKKLYQKFLDNLELVGKDSIDKTKIKALSTLLELLAGNPEQESLLLGKIVNKLGDPSRTIAAKAMYLLSQLLERHPVMKWVVVGEVERLLYRHNIAARAQYFGICFLSQILLEKFNQDNLAGKLVKIYFSFFTVSVKKGEVDTKLMKALLTGVNRAFPYAKLDPAELDQQLETMHKLVHLVSFNISIQALTLLYQVMDARESVTDRFYSALYKKILDPELTTSSKQVMFLNLLYKAIKADQSVPRVKAFCKRLLQVISYQPSHLVCGLLFLMSEVIKARPEIVITEKPSETEDAVDKFNDDDSDEEEHFQDAPDEDDENESGKSKSVKSGWTFKAKSSTHDAKSTYDPTARNPLYCGAETSHNWELHNLSQHFHPSATLFASNILEGVPIKYTGDPLSDFTLPRFLDRFVFRNPKKNPEKNKPTTVLGKRNIYKPAGIKAVAPDSKDFINREESNVPSDELFIYKYFQEKIQRKGAKVDDDVASVTSEEFNDFLDNLGGKGNDFDDGDDLDFAGGLGEENDDGEEKADDDDDDDGEEDVNNDDSDEEPTGLDGEDDSNFKDLSSSDEENEDKTELDEEGFGGDDNDDDDELDEEGFGGSDDDEDEPPAKKSKQKFAKMKFKKFDPNDLSSILADAEEFSHLIEENDADAGTSSSVVNKDKASKKQISWESNNENFMKGQNWKNKKKFGNKRNNKFMNKNKKGKRN